MPNNINYPGIYGDPENTNVSVLYLPGSIGARVTLEEPPTATPAPPFDQTGTSKSYQLIQLDSSLAAAATQNQLTWWKDKTRYIATTNQQNALSRNAVSGIIKAPQVNQGNFTYIQYKGAALANCSLADAAAFTRGDKAIPAAAAQGQVTRVPIGTAPTHTVVGECCGAGDATFGTVPLDLQIPETT